VDKVQLDLEVVAAVVLVR
jgi:hypothetical protein